jgi:hypothetical protein
MTNPCLLCSNFVSFEDLLPKTYDCCKTPLPENVTNAFVLSIYQVLEKFRQKLFPPDTVVRFPRILLVDRLR